MIRIIVAEDEPLILRSIVRMIEGYSEDLKVVATAEDGQEMKMLMQDMQADVYFLDINMPFYDGLELTQMLRKTGNTAPVIIITGYREFSYAQQAIKLGISDYILKPLDREELYLALQRAEEQIKAGQEKEQQDMMMEAEGTRETVSGTMQGVKEYLDLHYKENCSTQSLAQKFNYDVTYLSKRFKKLYGKSIWKYQLDRRMEVARELLLRNPQMLQKDVADYVGYQDPLYFSRIFKKETGMYPTEYRAVHRKHETEEES